MLKELSLFTKEFPLKSIVKHHELILGHKLITPLIHITTVLKFILTMVTCLDFIINGQGEVFLKYHSMSFCTSFYVVVYLAVEHFQLNSTQKDKFEDLKCFWSLETATLSAQKKLKALIGIIHTRYNYFLLLTFTQVLLSIFIGFFTNSSLYPEKIYLRKFFTGFPKIEFIMESFVNFSHALCIALSPGFIMFVKYGSALMKTQLYLLSDYVKRTDSYKISEDENVEKHLKICCTQHILICRYFRHVHDIICITIPAFVLTGLFYFLGVLVCIHNSVNFLDKLQASGLLLMGILFTVDICYEGQSIQDGFELLSKNLVETKWYNWNQTDKKILLMMIIRSQQTMSFELLTVRINRAVIIQMTRLVYQIFLVFQSTM